MVSALSLIAVFLFTYLALLAFWLLIHFREISTWREKRDTFATAIVSAGYVTLHAVTFSRSAECGESWTAACSILVTICLGWYVERSLERRLSWYRFCAQEEAKRAPVS